MKKLSSSQRTAIVVNRKTKSQLQKLGSIGDTFDSVIISLLKHVDKCDTFWSDRF